MQQHCTPKAENYANLSTYNPRERKQTKINLKIAIVQSPEVRFLKRKLHLRPLIPQKAVELLFMRVPLVTTPDN